MDLLDAPNPTAVAAIQSGIQLALNASAVAQAVLAGNVDSTGAESISAAKVLELLAAFVAGKAAYDQAAGVWTLFGRDGQTPVASVTLAGIGNRTAGNIQ